MDTTHVNNAENPHHRVAILAHSSVSLFELGCAAELFALPRPEFGHWYHCDIVTLDNAEGQPFNGLTLQASLIDSLASYDTLIIPSWPTSCSPSEKLRAELLDFSSNDKRLISFCSGAFLLAEIGLLDHKRATTHWQYAALFQQRFPQIHYVDDVLYVYEDKLACSAGSAAALDLGLAIIAEDFGQSRANQVARRLVISGHRRGGQAQFAETPLPNAPNHLGHALDWAIANLEKAITITDIATHANMSRRTFDRAFRSAMNTSPKEWLTTQRLARAKHLLEASDTNIERLAEQAGFSNATTLRHHFRKLMGISPTRYREQFNQLTKRPTSGNLTIQESPF